MRRFLAQPPLERKVMPHLTTKEIEMLRTSPFPWKRDQYENVLDANGERVSLIGCALATGRVDSGDVCHGNTALLFAAPILLAAAQKALDECCDLSETDAGNALADAITLARGEA